VKGLVRCVAVMKDETAGDTAEWQQRVARALEAASKNTLPRADRGDESTFSRHTREGGRLKRRYRARA